MKTARSSNAQRNSTAGKISKTTVERKNMQKRFRSPKSIDKLLSWFGVWEIFILWLKSYKESKPRWVWPRQHVVECQHCSKMELASIFASWIHSLNSASKLEDNFTSNISVFLLKTQFLHKIIKKIFYRTTFTQHTIVCGRRTRLGLVASSRNRAATRSPRLRYFAKIFMENQGFTQRQKYQWQNRFSGLICSNFKIFLPSERE